MIDWMQDHAWATWLGIAVVLALVELLSLDLVLLMFALGALAAAVVTGLGGPLWLAIVVFILVTVALVLLVRPPLVARLHDGPTLMTGHQALVGHTAIVVEPVDHRQGRVQLSGELWSARTQLDAESFDTGTEVLVTRIDGATVIVTAAATTKES
ncbi:NfeD family protein [Aeromicrobium sp. A1-2]|uniref:NfeD family protein n=1 Tax=Aeromicrobium sp. A1-2 TaxID=2107713 RepID=UPI001C1F8596|nr:NfeD family protein [Aeromicrobium sp. A1-2]